jgi:hypothetical protein
MYPFTLERPTTLADASRLAGAGVKLLAGGQTLLASMKMRLASPEQVADLGAVAELADIKREGNALRIGAMTRHADVAVNADVLASIPALADLASGIGDRQVRAMGTLGGSVANNDPCRLLPQRRAGAGRHSAYHAAPDCSRRLLPGHVCHGAERRRNHHRNQLPRARQSSLHEVSPTGFAFCHDRRVCGADVNRCAGWR